MKPRQMDPFATQPPAFPATEYRLVLPAHESLWDEVRAVQAAFARRYKAAAPVKTRPFIPLVRFHGFNMAQGRLLRELRALLSRERPFSVTLEGFGSLPTHTIHIPVSSLVSIGELEARLKKLKPLMRIPEKDPHFIEDPCLVIAQKLPPGQYEKAWMEFSKAHFRGVFVADQLLLLCRPAGQFKASFSPLAAFPLEAKSRMETCPNSLFEKIP